MEALPYKPSTVLEVISIDKADENEGIVVALSECQYGRKYDRKKGWEHNGLTFPHSVRLGDRVMFAGSYQDLDVMRLNGKKYRCLDSWEVIGIIEKPQPQGYEDLKTGEMLPDKHPLLIV